MRNLNKNITLIFLFSGVVLFVSCKKDDNLSVANSRIIESNYYSNDTLTSKDMYEYEGERMITKWYYKYEDQMDTTRKSEIEYPSSQTSVMIYFEKEDGEWNETVKQELEFQNDLISQVITYYFTDGSWEPSTKSTWQYENGKVLEILHYILDEGNFRALSKINYEYNNGKIKRLSLYRNEVQGWQLKWKEEYENDGGKVKRIIGYDYYEGTFHEGVKYEFSYTGNVMMSMEQFLYKDGIWSPKGETRIYIFNDSGILNSYSFVDQNSNYKVEYFYEEGRGNYKQLFDYPIGQTYDILPRPTKSIDILKEMTHADEIPSKSL